MVIRENISSTIYGVIVHVYFQPNRPDELILCTPDLRIIYDERDGAIKDGSMLVFPSDHPVVFVGCIFSAPGTITAAVAVDLLARFRRGERVAETACPHCGRAPEPETSPFGSTLRAMERPFEVGDRIRIKSAVQHLFKEPLIPEVQTITKVTKLMLQVDPSGRIVLKEHVQHA